MVACLRLYEGSMRLRPIAFGFNHATGVLAHGGKRRHGKNYSRSCGGKTPMRLRRNDVTRSGRISASAPASSAGALAMATRRNAHYTLHAIRSRHHALAIRNSGPRGMAIHA